MQISAVSSGVASSAASGPVSKNLPAVKEENSIRQPLFQSYEEFVQKTASKSSILSAGDQVGATLNIYA